MTTRCPECDAAKSQSRVSSTTHAPELQRVAVARSGTNPQRSLGNQRIQRLLRQIYVTTDADTTPEVTAARLLGNARYGPYLAKINGINGLAWRAGLRLLVPQDIDDEEAERVLRETYASEAAVIHERREQVVRKAIGSEPILVATARPGIFALSKGAAKFLSGLLEEGFDSTYDLGTIEFRFVPELPGDTMARTARQAGGALIHIDLDESKWNDPEWMPGSAHRLALIVHELTHVVQGGALSRDELRLRRERMEREAEQGTNANYTMPKALRNLPFRGLDPSDTRFTLEQMANRAAYELLVNRFHDKPRWWLRF
jgi:hypothetical protein